MLSQVNRSSTARRPLAPSSLRRVGSSSSSRIAGPSVSGAPSTTIPEPVSRTISASPTSGVTTTAVLLGASGAAWIFRGIVLAAALYGYLVIGTPFALALLVALVLPLTPQQASRTWDICRLLFGGVWGALLVLVFLGHLV